MIDSNYLVFIRPEIIPYLQSVEIYGVEKIKDSDCLVCSKVHPSSLLPGFVDLTLPKIQDGQDMEFVASIPLQYIVYICWADNETLNKIPGFRSKKVDVDNHLEPPDHSLSGSEPKHHFET